MAKTRAQIARKHATGGPAPAGGARKHATGGPAPAGGASPAPTDGRGGGRSNGSLVLVAAAVAALFLFWYFHLLALGQMTQLADGLGMPDSLVGGYDVGYVERLRVAMDDDARGQLSYLHRTAGTLFPLMFAFAWLLLVQLNIGRRPLRWLLWSPAILFAVADLWENVAIDAALAQSVPEPAAVALASALTVTRWILLASSLVAGAVAAFLPLRLRGHRHVADTATRTG